MLSDYLSSIEATQAALDSVRADLYANIGRLFREARQSRGWSQRELAGLLGVSHTYVSKIENGAVRPGMPTIKRMVELLGEER